MDVFCLSHCRSLAQKVSTSHPPSSVKPERDPATSRHLGAPVRLAVSPVLQDELHKGTQYRHTKGPNPVLYCPVFHIRESNKSNL